MPIDRLFDHQVPADRPQPLVTVSPPSTRRQTGADVVVRALEASGVDLCFGIPGGAILPIYDALTRASRLRHVLARHEQGAGHMAQGYARATGRPGVVFATSGPGATNLVTPIADAQMDSTPLVCITGQVRTDLIGTDAFQECDIIGVTLPLVKHSWQVRDPEEVAEVVAAACALAIGGRPGPVLVDIPRDVQEAFVGEAAVTEVAAGKRVAVAEGALAEGALAEAAIAAAAGMEAAIAAAAAAIDQSLRPVLYVGGGAQGCAPALLDLAERGCLPVVTTMMGKGAFPEYHPLFVGWPGMHGTKAANRALHDADLILAAGARFDDRVTGRVDAFAPSARVVHIDVDPYELHKIRHADVPIAGPLGETLPRLAAALQPVPAQHRRVWGDELASWQRRFPLRHATSSATGTLKPQQALADVARAIRDYEDVVWTTGVGQHQMWAMQVVPVHRPRSFISSGGLGTMGFGLPAAIGASLGRPGARVVCVDGDGSFQMTLQELATAVAARLPVTVVILNNGRLGMVHQWQTMFYEHRLSASDLRNGMPDFAAIARGFGALGATVTTAAEMRGAVADALATPGPAVLDVHVDPDEACYPMILPGGAAVDQVEGQGTPVALLGCDGPPS